MIKEDGITKIDFLKSVITIEEVESRGFHKDVTKPKDKYKSYKPGNAILKMKLSINGHPLELSVPKGEMLGFKAVKINGTWWIPATEKKSHYLEEKFDYGE